MRAVDMVDVVKRYGLKTAVDHVDFGVQLGETMGLLGSNGAGKSSIMRMVSAVSRATSGRVTVMGLDCAQEALRVRSQIGVVAQDDSLDLDLSVRDNLRVYGSYFGFSRRYLAAMTDELVEDLGMRSFAGTRVGFLSGGYRRRVSIARALINKPRLVLLDEPTSGLDPQSRSTLWEILGDLKARGITVVVSTHHFEEAERLCDRVTILHRGEVRAVGPISTLVGHLELAHTNRTPAVYPKDPGIMTGSGSTVAGAIAPASEVGNEKVSNRAGLEVRSLEGVYFSVTGEQLDCP